MDWPETALRLAHCIAKFRSQDPFVQVGACIIKKDKSIILGYNGSPAGIEIDWRDRDERRKRVIHAEENVLTNVKSGESWIMAVTALPCSSCIRLIANKGIRKIYYGGYLKNYPPKETFELAEEFGIDLVSLAIHS